MSSKSASAVLTPFRELGDLLLARWQAAAHPPGEFPDLALEALREHRLHERLDANDLLRLVLSSDNLPRQHDIEARFGQPPITLYWSDRFSISALFWVEADTALHQHNFSGAFGILRGSSLHCTYAFDELQLVSEPLRHGRLRSTGVEQLGPGEYRPIAAGAEFIHSLYHLDRPTVSLVIRTHRDKLAGPQYVYYPPGIAIDSFFEPSTLQRTLQVLSTLLGLEHPSLPEWLPSLLERTDPFGALRILLLVDGHGGGRSLMADLLRITRERFGELGETMVQVLIEERTRASLIDKRRRIEDADLRYLLALLINIQNREHILRLVGERWPQQDPIDVTVDLVGRLLAFDDVCERTVGPGAVRVLRRVMAGMSQSALVAEARAASGMDLPPTEVARLAMILPHISLFRNLMRTASA